MTADDRADQIRARLAYAERIGASGTDVPLADLAFLLAEVERLADENDSWLRHARIVESQADRLLAERDELLRRVEQAERAGAVEALRAQAAKVALVREHGLKPGEVAAPYAEYIEEWLKDGASHIKQGADL